MNKKSINKKITLGFVTILIILIMIVATKIINPINNNHLLKETIEDGTQTLLSDNGGMNKLGNRVKNPHIRYAQGASTIPEWKIDATDNVYGGVKSNLSITNKKQYTSFRSITGFDYYAFLDGNPSGVFQAKSVGSYDNSTAFYLISQTVTLVQGKKYYFRGELSSSGGTSQGILNIYPGTATSGSGIVANQSFTINNNKQIIELPINTTHTTVTISMRHNRNPDSKITLSVHELGFYLEDDYLLQKELDSLFEDLTLTALKYDDLAKIQEKITEINKKITDQPALYSDDVKEYVKKGLETATKQKKDFETLYKNINDSYTDDSKTTLKNTVDGAYLDDLKKKIESVSSTGFKNDFSTKYETVKNIHVNNIVNDITEKANKAKNEIDALDISDEDKIAYKNKIDSELEKAITSVKNTQNPLDYSTIIENINNQINTEKNNAGNKSDGNRRDKKLEVIQMIEAKSATIKSMIDSLENLTVAEKNLQKEQVAQTKNQAIAAVNAQESIQAITQKGSEGITKLEDAFLRASQLNYANEMDKYLDERTIDIKNLKQLTDQEKGSRITELTEINNDTKNKIKLADNQETVISLKEAGKTEMRAVYLSAIKENSIKYLNQQALSLSNGEMSAELNNLLQDQIELVNSKTTPALVEEQMYKSYAIIKLKADKENAIKRSQNLLINYQDIISKLKYLDNERDGYNSRFEAKLTSLITKINEQLTDSNILIEEEKGKNDLNSILFEAIRKDADNRLNEMLQLNLDKTDKKTPGLSSNEIDSYKDDLNAIKQQAIKNISELKNQNDINNEVNKTLEKYQVKMLEITKKEYTNLLNSKVSNLKIALKDVEKITPEEVKEFGDIFDEIMTEALKSLNNSNSEEHSLEIYNKAVKDLDNVWILIKETSAQKYIDNLNERANSINQVIRKLDYIDKEHYIGLVNTELSKASLEIEGDKEDLQLVKTRYVSTVTEMENMLLRATLESEKGASSKALNDKKNDVLRRIKEMEHLKEKDLDDFDAELKGILQTGLDNVDSKTTIEEIKTVKSEYLLKLEAFYDKAYKKDKAILVKDRYDYIILEIEKLTDLPLAIKTDKLAAAEEIVNNLEKVTESTDIKEADEISSDKVTRLNEILSDSKKLEKEHVSSEKIRLNSDLDDKINQAITVIENYESLAGNKKNIVIEELERIRSRGKIRITNAEKLNEANEHYNEAISRLASQELSAKRENAFDEIQNKVTELLDGGKMSDEINKMITKTFADINNETSYEKIDNFVKEAISDLESSIVEGVRIIKNKVKTELESYLKRPSDDETRKIIDAQILKVENQNYDNDEEIEEIITSGKRQIDAYYQSLIDEAKNKFKEELEKVAEKPISSGNEQIIDDYLKEITIDNYDNKDKLDEMLEKAKDDVIDQNKVDFENAKQRSRDEIKKELEIYLKKPIDDEIEKIIEGQVSKINDENYNNQEEKGKIIVEGKQKIDDYYQKLLDDARDKFKKELEEVAKKPITSGNKDIIEDYLKEVTLDNFDNEEEIKKMIEKAKEDIINQNEKDFEDTKNRVKDELEKKLEKPIPDNIKEIIEEIISKVNEDNYLDEDSLKEIIDKGKEVIKEKELDNNKKENVKELEDLYNSHKDSGIYKDDALDKLKEIYDKALDDIKKSSTNTNDILNKAKEDINNIKIFEVTTGDFTYDDIEKQTTGTAITAGIKNITGMPIGTKIEIKKIELSADENKTIKRMIDKKEYGKMRNSNILIKYNISLLDKDDIKFTKFEGTYEVKILLNIKLDETKTSAMIYRNGDNIEVFELTNGENWISFKTTHFSDFYLIEEGNDSTNTYWIIGVLALIISLEIAIIVKKRSFNRLNH